jgi:hypothetical protein
MQMRPKQCRVFLAALSLATIAIPQARAGFMLGDAANFVVLYEGNGNNQLGTTNVTINGNIGIGDPSGVTTAYLAASGGTPAAINGNVLYAGAVSPKNSIQNTTFTGTVSGGNGNVQTDLNYLNGLSTTLGGEVGAALTVNLNNNQSQTIDASSGMLDGNGNRVFSVSSFNFGNGATLTINGDGAGDSVVLNFSSNAQFGGNIVLNGITSDQVLFNITGGASLTGGNTLQDNTNGANLTGTFLDPNGAVSVVHTVLTGRIFGGDTSNMQIVSGDTVTAPTGLPEPSSAASFFSLLGGLGAVLLLRKLRTSCVR